jgi:hypothetical protein
LSGKGGASISLLCCSLVFVGPAACALSHSDLLAMRGLCGCPVQLLCGGWVLMWSGNCRVSRQEDEDEDCRGDVSLVPHVFWNSIKF